MIPLEQLKFITNRKDIILSPFVAPLNDTLINFYINTPTKQAHFISQISHESGAFLFTEEIASGIAYEGRLDLGNTTSGDGMRYKGRGLIQLTGKNNYKKLSDFFKVDFVNNPVLLKTPEWACKSAGWFWNTRKLNDWSDKNDFLMITYLINGGFNGLAERFRYFKKCLNVFQVVDRDIILNSIFSTIENNITDIKDTRFKVLLFKAIPNLNALNSLKNS